MILELHDNVAGNTLLGRIKEIDYDYQAEMWVQETAERPVIVKWVLVDFTGTRCVWERPADKPNEMPEITGRSARFTGEWKRGPTETVIPEPYLANN